MAKDFNVFVNEPLGVVVAKFPSASDELRVNFFKQLAKFERENKCLGEFFWDTTEGSLANYAEKWFEIYGPIMNELIGKSKCNYEDGDVFNVEFGTQLAKKRLAAKLERYWCDFYAYMVQGVYSLQQNFLDLAAHHYRRASSLEEKANDMENSLED